MSCVNKSHPNFKLLSKQYGDIAAESIVREYTRYSPIQLPSGSIDFLYPSPTQTTDFFNKYRVLQERVLDIVLSYDPNLEKKHIFNILKGVITGPRNKVTSDHLVHGNNDNDVLLNANRRLFDRLIEKYPFIFSYKQGGTTAQHINVSPGAVNAYLSESKISELFAYDNSISDFITELKSPYIKNPKYSAALSLMADKLSDKFKVKWAFDLSINKKGEIRNGKIYINPNLATPDTPVHEFFHPFLELIKKDNPTLYTVLIKKAQQLTLQDGSLLIDSVRQRYSDYSEYRLLEETLVEGAGLIAVGDILEQESKNIILDALKAILNFIFKAFGKIPGFVFNENTPISSVINGFLHDNTVINLNNYVENNDQRMNSNDIVTRFKEMENEIEAVFVPIDEDPDTTEKFYKHINSGLQIKSVHTKILQPFYDKLFPNKITKSTKSEFAKNIGIVIHDNLFREIFDNVIDPLTGHLLDGVKGNLDKIRKDYLHNIEISIGGVPHPDDNSIALLNEDDTKALYYQIANLAFDVLSFYEKKYGPKARFFYEQKLYSLEQEVAGTADLIVLNDTHFSVLDWKSINSKRYDIINNKFIEIEILPAYKETAYKLQLSAYAKLISKITGLEFDNGQAIPIGLQIENAQDEDDFYIKDEYRLTDVSYQPFGSTELLIGDNELEKRYLLPVKLDNEVDDHVAKLLKKLQSLIDKYQKAWSMQNYDKSFLKELRLNELRKIIQDITIRKNANGIYDRIVRLLHQADLEIAKEDANVSVDNLQDLIEELESYRELVTYFTEDDLKDTILASKIALTEKNVNATLLALKQKRTNVFKEDAKGFGIENLDANEKEYKGLKRYSREISAISDVKTISYFWGLREKLANTANIRKLEFHKKLLKYKNLSKEDTDLFFKRDEKGNRKAQLIAKLDIKGILEELTYANTQGEDFLDDFIDDNFIFDTEKYTNAKKKYIEYVEANLAKKEVIDENNAYSEVIDDYNKKIDKQKEKLIEAWIKDNISPAKWKDSEAKQLNLKFYKIRPEFEKLFLTKEYKKLIESQERKDLFELLLTVNEEAYQNGFTKNRFIFYPSVLASNLEKAILDQDASGLSLSSIKKRFEKGIEDDETSNSIVINPLTGESEFVIPQLYNSKLSKKLEDGTFSDEDYSFDLLKVYATFYEHLEDYKYKQDLSEKATFLVEIEKEKKSLAVLENGRIQVEFDILGNEIPKIMDNTGKNLDLLRTFINYQIYGRTGFSDYADTKIVGNVSAVKLLRQTMAWRSMTTLGLNLLSATSAAFGGFSNIYLESNRNGVFTKKDSGRALKAISELPLKTPEALKILALIHQVDPLIDNLSELRANELSINNLNKVLTTEHLYILLRNVDKSIQYTVAHSTLQNFTIVDGELKNIRNLIKEELDYDNEFKKLINNKDYAGIKKLEDQLKEKTEAYKETNSLITGDYTLEDKHVIELRALTRKLSSKVIGNSSREDVNAMKLTMLGSVALQFKNWMPRLATERFGSAEMDNVTKSLNWGKYITFKDTFDKDFLKTIMGVYTQLTNTTYDKIVNKHAELLREHLLNGGTDSTFISLSDFKNLYIANIKSTLTEILMMLCITILIYSLHILWDDDNKTLNGYQRLGLNMLNKMLNEISFYLSPKSATDLINKPFPVVQTLTDMMSFVQHTSKYSFNLAQNTITHDEEKDLQKSHPGKYFFKLFPVTKEAMNWLAIIDEDFRKKWDINLRYN